MALVTLRSYRNLIEAELAIAQLEAAGISAVVIDQQLGSTFSAAIGEVRLQVDESNLAIARGLLQENVSSELMSQPHPGERRRHWSGRSIWTLVLLCVLFAYCTYKIADRSGYNGTSAGPSTPFEKERPPRGLW
jgi:hypothetical protein